MHNNDSVRMDEQAIVGFKKYVEDSIGEICRILDNCSSVARDLVDNKTIYDYDKENIINNSENLKKIVNSLKDEKQEHTEGLQTTVDSAKQVSEQGARKLTEVLAELESLNSSGSNMA